MIGNVLVKFEKNLSSAFFFRGMTLQTALEKLEKYYFTILISLNRSLVRQKPPSWNILVVSKT